ncbi:VOC family protein [Streptomyces sp. LP05-1]|uniref:VOC family protein n=1 Tax=Streptomyces pyxinae TaxID=2970734 RepID=A0ABT2CDK1_9ACTN|nr:VOC family protein [Streptomyces sp. LP05-1]MCS0634699.1 VOC family protein [Streptomyces sp. LP05-1]
MLTTHYVPGTPNWLDLGAPDVDAAADFYRSVFGWTFHRAGPEESGEYGFFRLGDRTVAAAGPLTGEAVRSAWTPYFATADAEATAAAVERAGGSVRVAPDDVGTAGRLAAFTDPAGAEFAVWQPGDIAGLDVVMEPDTLCWTELYTTDRAAAKDFYTAVFSWSYDDMTAGDTVYSVASSPGGGKDGDSGQSGILELAGEHLAAGSRPEWHPYFGVTDCDTAFARATGHGATVLIPPMDAPGVGRVAMVADPAGAPFALIKGDPETT